VSAILFLVLRILLVAVLYAFLGLAFYTIWRDMKQQGQLLVARQPPPITLSTNVDDEAFTRQYSSSEVVLGRESSCDFPISSQTISARHARLSYHQSQWWLEDLASTNGTYLNGEAIHAPVVITHGDDLRLGDVEINITIGDRVPMKAT
jgi:pSer/pThr/pTyr-binding forkhead associated (FHA) protein